jgi:tRNA A-37 threonylcarbamoyl transferase component Bud32
MAANTKVIGLKTSEMAKALKDMIITILILDVLRREKHMEMEFIHGKMEKYMMENGIKGSNMDMAYGKGRKMTHMSENGVIVKHMDLVFINGIMEISMKESGTCA